MSVGRILRAFPVRPGGPRRAEASKIVRILRPRQDKGALIVRIGHVVAAGPLSFYQAASPGEGGQRRVRLWKLSFLFSTASNPGQFEMPRALRQRLHLDCAHLARTGLTYHVGKSNVL